MNIKNAFKKTSFIFMSVLGLFGGAAIASFKAFATTQHSSAMKFVLDSANNSATTSAETSVTSTGDFNIIIPVLIAIAIFAVVVALAVACKKRRLKISKHMLSALLVLTLSTAVGFGATQAAQAAGNQDESYVSLKDTEIVVHENASDITFANESNVHELENLIDEDIVISTISIRSTGSAKDVGTWKAVDSEGTTLFEGKLGDEISLENPITIAPKEKTQITWSTTLTSKEAINACLCGTTPSNIEYSIDKVASEAYGVLDSEGTLSLYYDSNKDTREGTKYDIPTSASSSKDWEWDNDRRNVTKVIIDSSFQKFNDLLSTDSMFIDMVNASSIIGAEYIDVSNVTSMRNMFNSFGSEQESLNVVPNVSNWETSKVTNISKMFNSYAYKSKCLNSVPDMSNWNINKIIHMYSTFCNFGFSSTLLTKVPDVSKWNTCNVKNMQGMFAGYAYCSISLNVVPDVLKWNTSSVTDMTFLFERYGHESTSLKLVPDVSKWNTRNVEYMNSMFSRYGNKSKSLQTLDLSDWDITCLKDGHGESVAADNMFFEYGNSCDVQPVVYGKDWTSVKTLNGKDMFKDANLKGTGDNWSSANTSDEGRFTLKPTSEPAKADTNWKSLYQTITTSTGETVQAQYYPVFNKVPDGVKFAYLGVEGIYHEIPTSFSLFC